MGALTQASERQKHITGDVLDVLPEPVDLTCGFFLFLFVQAHKRSQIFIGKPCPPIDLKIPLSSLFAGEMRHGNGVFLIVLVLAKDRLTIPCDAIGIDAVKWNLLRSKCTLQRTSVSTGSFNRDDVDFLVPYPLDHLIKLGDFDGKCSVSRLTFSVPDERALEIT